MNKSKTPQGNEDDTFNSDYADNDLGTNISTGSVYIPKTYKIDAKCVNCGHTHQYTIVQGIKVV